MLAMCILFCFCLCKVRSRISSQALRNLSLAFLADFTLSGSTAVTRFIQTKYCNPRCACVPRVNYQKWSLYKVKGAFSTPICARKQTNGPPIIDQGSPTGSCNRHHTLSGRAVDPYPTLSASAEPSAQNNSQTWSISNHFMLKLVS